MHITHNLSLYIKLDLDYQTAEIKTTDGTILQTQVANTINLHVSVENKYIQIELSNVPYLPRLNTNLILFGVLEKKRYEFYIVNGLLQIKDKEDNIVMEFLRDNGVNSLW